MKINFVSFKTLDLGSKTVLITIGVAFISLFLPWIDWRNQNAFLEGEFLLFIPYLYPLIAILLGKAVHFLLGMILAVIPVIGNVFLLSVYRSDPYQDPQAGMYLFLIAGLVILAGMVVPRFHNLTPAAAETEPTASTLGYVHFVKVAVASSILGTAVFWLASVIYNSIRPFNPLFASLPRETAGIIALSVFLGLLIFFLLLGLVRKWFEGNRIRTLAAFLGMAIVTNILLTLILRVYVFRSYLILISIALPLAIFYRTSGGLKLANTLKIVLIMILLKIVYEFIWYQLFTGIFFRLMILPVLSWIDIFLHDGSLMLVVIYICDRFVGEQFSLSSETSEMGLKQYLKEFFRVPKESMEGIESPGDVPDPSKDLG